MVIYRVWESSRSFNGLEDEKCFRQSLFINRLVVVRWGQEPIGKKPDECWKWERNEKKNELSDLAAGTTAQEQGVAWADRCIWTENRIY